MSNLLIVRLSSFGDIVLTEPIARAVKQQYPESDLWFVAAPEYAEIPQLFASVDSVLAYSKDTANPELDRVARSVAFDAIIDLQGNLRSRVLTGRFKTGSVVRHRRQQLLRFLSVHAPWIWKGSLKHTVESYGDTVKPLGIVLSDHVPAVRPPQECVDEAVRAFGRGPFIGICPGGSSMHKRWRQQQFTTLIRWLIDDGRQVLVIGSDADRPVAESVCGKIENPGPALYVGNEVGMTAALLSLCAVTVTNDSGLMHLAGAVGSRPVAIFGPTSPLLGFAPMAGGAAIVTRGLACSPCSYHGNKPCKYNTRQCLDEIDPREVAGIVNDMIAESQPDDT